MILVLSNEQDATAEFLEGHLHALGVEFLRVNTEHLATCTLDAALMGEGIQGAITVGSCRVRLADVTSVYYRRPIAPTLDDLADRGLARWMSSEIRRAWGGVLSALPLNWVNHPAAISAASYKVEQLVRARRRGLIVPDTLVTSDPHAALGFCQDCQWDVVAKPISQGFVPTASGSDGRLVYTQRLCVDHTESLAAVRGCPTLLQRSVAKGTDIRVTVIDATCFAAELRLPEGAHIDCRHDDMRDVDYVPTYLPDSLREQLVGFTQSYGLRYGAIDVVRHRDGSYWFLELNPAGQWAWIEERTGLPIRAALTAALTGTGQYDVSRTT